MQLLCQLDNCAALCSSDSDDHRHAKGEVDIYTALPSRITINRDDVRANSANEPYISKEITSFPFIKGWIGAAGYEDALNYFAYYTWCYTYFHKQKKGFFVFSDECSEDTEQKIASVLESLRGDSVNDDESKLRESSVSIDGLSRFGWKKSQDFSAYAASFTKLQDYILSGDCYQANLTQRFEAKCQLGKEELISAFFADVTRSQASYCAFIEISPDNYLISLSPEKFIDSRNRHVKSKPIKGTVKSSGKIRPEEKRMLLNEKNKAENLMIVDLLRNDMSKVSKLNSVRVSKLFAIESYENVHHLVSTIESELKDNISEIDAFWAAFPGGSITGTPKKRAMEIIDELEVHSRRYYCGSIFYWDFRGNFDSSILIRTAEKVGDKIYCWAGGGIVADSQLESEYQESLDKVRHITGIEE